MEVQSDFRDLLALFRKHDIDFILVGAYALAFHGVQSFTGDIEFSYGATRTTARRSSLR
jgi:hypothetical protein